jgi:RNA-directed DNA polymerase
VSSGMPRLLHWNGPELTARDFYRRRRQLRQAARSSAPSEPALVPATATVPSAAQIFDPEGLLVTFRRMSREAGRAPGQDGLSYKNVSIGEMAGILRTVSSAVMDGTYRPLPCRLVPIPKLKGGMRELRLRSIADRVVATALNDSVTPFWETVFAEQSHAWRQERGPWTLLRELDVTMERLNWHVLAIDDVRRAFDNVVIDRVMAHHARHILDSQLLHIIETILRGHEGKQRRIGIDQGSAYSPTALNIYMHYAHDIWIIQSHLLFWRYGDNLVYLCRNKPEGYQVLDYAGNLLAKADLALKGEDAAEPGSGPVVDLQKGQKPELLGLQLLLQGGRLIHGLGKMARLQLTASLKEAHEAENPALAAQQAVLGWAEAYGPAFPSLGNDTLYRVLKVVAQLGFREVCSPNELGRRCKSSYRRWCNYRREAYSLQPVEVAAPLATTNADGAR